MSDQPVGRGGLKLEAAIAHFGLAQKIAGGRALDIGASTGGFTEALLRHGAAHVVAVDVGHGQLHPSLTADARVTNLEGVHWKTLSLDIQPGPFDFFTVDVSFVAARTMLRGLAFRLRPGAEGVVLVKPQFELPDGQVKGGNVTDPQLRKRALDQVREKAESLGFQLAGFTDSPVAGREGTVEILAHLRFVGRSEKLPQPGERRRGSDAKPAPTARPAPGVQRYFAVAAPGIEPVLAKEVAALEGVLDVKAVPGGVEFAGPAEVLYRANLWLRTATRVLVRLGELETREFPRLRHGAAKLRWSSFTDGTAPLDLKVSATKSRLYHTGAIAETLELAVGDAVKKREPTGAVPLGIYARGVEDRWTLSVDSSGELLHRRGWREEGATAPMRETLGAALLYLCEWDPTTPLVDPMCGAGTLAVEACSIAMRLAPGLKRSFAFQAWPSYDAAAFARVLAEAEAAQLPSPPAPILASDHAARAIDAARRNAERAGLLAQLRLDKAELAEVRPPEGDARGLVLVNPPYGRRVGDPRELRGLYTDLGRLLRTRFPGWRAGVLIADRRLDSALGMKPKRETPLQNGGIRVRLLELDVPGPRTPK